jgi:hypothetical protein
MADEQISEALKRLIKQSNNNNFFVAEVERVDKENFSLDAKLEDSDLSISGVRLNPSETAGKTLLQFPSIGTKVLLAKLDNTEFLLLSCDEVESVLWENNAGFSMEINSTGDLIFNGGDLGGLVKVQELSNQLNKNNVLLAAVLAVINGAPILEPGNAAPSALQIALKAAVLGKNLGDFSQLENPKIKQ